MNAKKVKAVRSFLRSKGINPREDRYIPVEATRRNKTFETGSLTADGKPVLAAYQTVTWRLGACGRAAYHGLKRAAA